MIGIIAFGSLMVDPGWEIKDAVAHTHNGFETPFEVEYAHSSHTHAGAPTLAPVPDGKGGRVKAKMFVLKPGVSLAKARDILYRRELNRVGDLEKRYFPQALSAANTVVVEEIPRFAGLEYALYARRGPNLPQTLDERLPVSAKASLLAKLAVGSVDESTYFTNRDGLAYLSAAIHSGVCTPLTSTYRREVLRICGGAPGLEEARVWIAKYRKTLI